MTANGLGAEPMTTTTRRTLPGLQQVVAWMDEALQVNVISDRSLNGLQVEGRKQLKNIALAVDASLETFHAAAACNADMLIVHHGLFWGQPLAVTGVHYQRLKVLMDYGISLYAAHLPLDGHPRWGNNHCLAQGVGLKRLKPFGDYHGVVIGAGGHYPESLSLQVLATRTGRLVGTAAKVLAFGPAKVKRLAIVSGGGGSLLPQARQEGYDTFLTGEFLHQDVPLAKELGMNVIIGGHYATETLGVQALGRAVAKIFSLRSRFLDCPTGF